MIHWRVAVCVLVVSALVGRVASRLDVLSARWTEKDRVLTRSVAEPEHRTLEEVSRELQVSRAKRQSDFGGSPTVDGTHTFEDGYRYARIHYSGEQSDVIFVLTYDFNTLSQLPTHTNLYRSLDYGHSFSNIERNLDSNDPDPLLWTNFYVSDFNKNTLVFPHATSAQMYITLNEGLTWQIQTFEPSTLDPRSLLWSPAPREDNWIIAHDRGNDLYVTHNLGLTWKMISTNVDLSDYQWAVPGVDEDLSTIFFNTIDPTHADNGDVHLYTTKYPYNPEDKQEFDPNLSHHDGFLVVGAYIFAQKTDGAGNIFLLVSYNRNPFNRAMIPSEVPHQNYLVSHINSLQALVIVEHTSGQYNLYLSDSSGVYFSLSLPDIQVEASVDLELIEGINGTMIANQFVRASPTVTNAPVRTLITFDNGGNWDLIRPPQHFLNGTLTNCEPPLCSLHFHMDSSAYARLGVYSTDTAPGIILAHGTIGESLSDDPDLFISRDVGVIWEQTLADSWGVTVADHGGLLVAARDYHQESSSVLKYSCDEGHSWRDFTFLSNTTMVVYGVITEPGEHTTIVSLYGVELGTGTTLDWAVVTVNFTASFDRMCTDDDYYDWRPEDERLGEECMLGNSIEIERRRADHCCLNGRDYDREFNFTVCLCTEDDFECDYGYEHANQISGPCVRDPDVDLTYPCTIGVTTFLQSTGYRKIAGDVCQGGVESQFAPRIGNCSLDIYPVVKELLLHHWRGSSTLHHILACI